MIDTRSTLMKATLIAILFFSRQVMAQSVPTATQDLQLSAFFLAAQTGTNIQGGQNSGVVAGVDVCVPAFHSIAAGGEPRGSYPIYDGSVSSQKSFALGPKVEYSV